jgi:ligand-binding sensor domain-containing protein/anti-sigma regulatory factor (Ser/Thr protein kinase)
MMLRLLCITMLTSLCEVAAGQEFDETSFLRYTKLDGLSNNFITAIVQDSSGYVWIATNKGLNRFDGKFFTSFFKSSENSPVPENLITSLSLQNNNEIIGTTGAGAFSYNTISRIHKYFIVPADSIIYFWANQGWQALKDRNGNYVVSTKTGLYVFNTAGKILSRYDNYKTSDAGRRELWFGNWLAKLTSGDIFQENTLSGSLYYSASNRIDTFYSLHTKKIKWPSSWKVGAERISFYGSHDELFLPNVETKSLDVYNLITGTCSSFAVPGILLADVDWYSKLFYITDTLLAITSKVGGFYLLQYSRAQNKIHCTGQKYFASKYCTSILRDCEGRLWIGTNDGLYKQTTRNPFFSVDDLSRQQPAIVNTGIQSVFVSKDKILIGLRNDGGVLVLNAETKKIERRVTFERFGPGSNTINFMFRYGKDTLWIGTGKGILWLNTNNYSNGKLNLPGQPNWIYRTKTRNYLQDSQGDIWLSFGELNSLILFDKKEHKFYDLSQSPLLRITFCFSMIEDRNKNVWIAGDGLCRWNRAKREIDTLIQFPRVTTSLFNYMQILDCDEHNNLWLASFDNEILQYSCNTNKMYLRLPENSMIDGYSVTNSGIINDHIWLGMANGISAFNIKTNAIKQFNYSDGLPSAVVTSHRKGSFYNEQENRFYFGAGHYLISFVPDIRLSNKPLPKFSIEATGINKMLSENIRLPYSQNDVELRFNVINFTDPEENRFAYRFANEKDSAWRELNTKNILVLSTLPAGSHNIEVRLYSVNNRWPSQLKTVNIVITPPFWKSWWFLTIVSLALATGSFLFYKSRISEVRKKASIDRQMAEFEIKALHAQMNPHFIFNCLNSIREMILNNENQQASHYLSKFAHLIRITLNQSSRPFISLKNTIDYMQRYLEMEKIRTAYFCYNIHVDRSIPQDDIFLPPMLIQPFIENAIWHGGGDQSKILRLDIRFVQRDGKLLCIVEDNGIGIKASWENKKQGSLDHNSVGIDNVRQRIGVLNEKYNLNSRVTIEDKSDVPSYNEPGTIVTLYLAIKNNLS